MICLELFLGFLQVGLFSFGGGYAAIPLIRDVVLHYGWLDDEMIAYMIAVSESTPGPVMINLATYVGSSQAGLVGAVLSTVAVTLPAFIIVLLVMILFRALLKNAYMQAVLQGLKPCIVGIILAVGAYMIFHNCFGTVGRPEVDVTAVGLTALLAVIYFGSQRLPGKGGSGKKGSAAENSESTKGSPAAKRGISPIALIGISAAAGIVIYGIL